MGKKTAFTLIELLIVVAIIGILAAIAVPNFLNAQIRAKIGRVRADHRAFTVALEAYFVDHNEYPWGVFPNQVGGYTTASLTNLTTPVSYISSVMQEDPFGEGTFGQSGPSNKKFYVYVNYNGLWARIDTAAQTHFKNWPYFKGYGMTSFGPDDLDSGGVWAPLNYRVGSRRGGDLALYAPSNGLISLGDICRYGGGANLVTAGG
ncbi:MAG: prepilin-type N-terminal cleavage/methylation domain-containing protein [Candidatus Omnitrophota bacterium]|nr:MAG: prepilin-type N-terminal cleavage/methylation domain-containing protein [Candidatus Omnitrophota bacterium]